MKTHIIIPARLDSTRLSRKLLLDETGKSLLIHTYENAKKSKDVDGIHIATNSNDMAIIEHCKENGIECIEVDTETTCGSHLCLLASKQFGECNIINVQGDCPNVSPNTIDEMIPFLNYKDNNFIITPYYKIEDTKIANDSARIKMVLCDAQSLIYYSRLPIPYGTNEWNIHVGVYGFPFSQVDTLLNLYNKGVKSANTCERLEQLMWLERGLTTWCIESPPCSSIDTQEDYDEFKRNCIGG